MLARRSVLKALGGAPLAARHAVSALDVADLKGMASFVGAGSSIAGIHAETAHHDSDDGDVKAASWLLANGIPEFVKDALRRDRRVPSGLDPDLAANRSFSLAAKVLLQRERNFERALVETMDRQRTTLARQALRKVGVALWW